MILRGFLFLIVCLVHLQIHAQKASLQVFDLTGKPVKKYDLDVTSTSLTIKGADLSAGMYLYALVVDGKLIDTKRMILE